MCIPDLSVCMITRVNYARRLLMSQRPPLSSEAEELEMEAQRPRIGDAWSTFDHSDDKFTRPAERSLCSLEVNAESVGLFELKQRWPTESELQCH